MKSKAQRDHGVEAGIRKRKREPVRLCKARAGVTRLREHRTRRVHSERAAARGEPARKPACSAAEVEYPPRLGQELERQVQFPFVDPCAACAPKAKLLVFTRDRRPRIELGLGAG